MRHDHFHHHESHLERKVDGLLCALQRIEENIMSSISDFAAKIAAFTTRQDAAIADLQADVQNLTDQIAALNTSAGQITPEDQALLDGIVAKASTVSDKLDALDALTPPKAP